MPPSSSQSARLISRLRAHKILPADVVAEVRRRNSGGIRWEIIKCLDETPMMVAGLSGIEETVKTVDWTVSSADGGYTIVTPALPVLLERELQSGSDKPCQSCTLDHPGASVTRDIRYVNGPSFHSCVIPVDHRVLLRVKRYARTCPRVVRGPGGNFFQ
jgi:hypothetical protein